MTHETMTVHQALCELKVLNKRVASAICETKPISTKEHSSRKVDGVTEAEFTEQAKASHNSAVDLINRQIAIKAAVSQYNSEKVITVAGKNYTVAQAIWMMQYGVKEKKSLLTRYTDMLRIASNTIERENGQRLNDRAESFTVSMCGNKDKADPKAYNESLEEYKKNHALELVDPMGIRKIISDMEKEISEFETGVDAAIQVANATTTLEISY